QREGGNIDVFLRLVYTPYQKRLRSEAPRAFCYRRLRGIKNTKQFVPFNQDKFAWMNLQPFSFFVGEEFEFLFQNFHIGCFLKQYSLIHVQLKGGDSCATNPRYTFE